MLDPVSTYAYLSIPVAICLGMLIILASSGCSQQRSIDAGDDEITSGLKPPIDIAPAPKKDCND